MGVTEKPVRSANETKGSGRMLKDGVRRIVPCYNCRKQSADGCCIMGIHLLSVALKENMEQIWG